MRCHPEGFEGNTIELEGHESVLVDTGYTDTALSTSLHVPSIDLVVAGDVAYNGVHPYMAEGNLLADFPRSGKEGSVVRQQRKGLAGGRMEIFL